MRDGDSRTSAAFSAFRIDARVKIAIMFLCAFALQCASDAVLLFFAMAFAALLTWNRPMAAKNAAPLRNGLAFVALWCFLKLAVMAAFQRWPAAADALAAIRLGFRLFLFIVLGILFAASASPHETGMAAAWFLRPFLGNGAWRAAVGLGSMIHFLPFLLRRTTDAMFGMRTRGLVLPWPQRIRAVCFSALRALDAKAWELAVCLASRRLDDPRAWLDFPPVDKWSLEAGAGAVTLILWFFFVDAVWLS